MAQTPGYGKITLLYSDEFIDSAGFHNVPNFGYNFISTGTIAGTFATAFSATY